MKNPGPKYRGRADAGKALASELKEYKNSNLIVLAIPNGGVPVALEVAREIKANLYLMIVRKLQIPGNPEAGFGAVTADGFLLLNHDLIERLGLSKKEIKTQERKALESIRRRQSLFGKQAEIPALNDRTVVLIDDGLASGFTMEAAVRSVRDRGAGQIIVAVPTSSSTAYDRLVNLVDKIVCPNLSQERFFAVADAYHQWYDLGEDEVMKLLDPTSRD
ncbi:MAG: phosphoribosyltransferase family protein [Candidatus Adiutricales bacterium]